MADGVRLGIAMAPILVVVVLLILRVRSLRAGVIGLGVAVAGALVGFPMNGTEIWAATAQMAPTVILVAAILLGGVGLAEAMTHGGAQDRIATWLGAEESGADSLVTLLMLVYGVTPFMESVTGFGLGAVIAAPLLIRLGLTPVKAVISALLGLVLVPWGSLGPGILISAQLGGQDLHDLGAWTAVLTLPVLIVSMAALLALTIGRPSPRQFTLAAAVVLFQWGVLTAVNGAVSTPLGGVLTGAAVIAALLALTRIRSGPLPPVDRSLITAVTPYGVLVLGILATTALTSVTDGRAPDWIASPAVWLIIAAITAVATLELPTNARWGVVRRALARWIPIAGTALVFMVMGIVMAVTGMAEHLAVTAAAAGYGFIATIPAIGALGGYLTGSNTGSAAMFSAATTTAAANLGANPLIALAGQNVAGSFAIIASPPRIALAVGVTLPSGQRLPRSATTQLFLAVTASVIVLGAAVLVLA